MSERPTRAPATNLHLAGELRARLTKAKRELSTAQTGSAIQASHTLTDGVQAMESLRAELEPSAGGQETHCQSREDRLKLVAELEDCRRIVQRMEALLNQEHAIRLAHWKQSWQESDGYAGPGASAEQQQIRRPHLVRQLA